MVNFSNLSLSNKICILATYASVFNDVIEIREVVQRLSPNEEEKIKEVIRQLHEKGLIIQKDGFIGIPNLKDKISIKKNEHVISEQLIAQGKKRLLKLSLLPFIEFVSISGSLAAKNPVQTTEKHLDIDVFVITSQHTIWIVGFLLAIFRNLSGKKTGQLCINHIWDGADLRVYNENFYVATEIYNMIPLIGKNRFYAFLEANKWVYDYYPGLVKRTETREKKLFSKGFYPLNVCFFLLFTLFRCLKNISFKPLKDLFHKTKDLHHITLMRRGAENGGYQQMIRKKFLKNWELSFAHIDDNLNVDQILFPDELSKELKANKDFNIYSRLKLSDQQNWALNLKKYQNEEA